MNLSHCGVVVANNRAENLFCAILLTLCRSDIVVLPLDPPGLFDRELLKRTQRYQTNRVGRRAFSKMK